MNDKPTKDLQNLSPITKWIYTIGVLPTSYVESMSYQEQLTWLCNYISQTLIPAVNTNAAATKELQDLFVELENYVNDYFDNLDVTEEINAKLDDMYENGELETLISTYVNTYVDETVTPTLTTQNTKIAAIETEVTNISGDVAENSQAITNLESTAFTSESTNFVSMDMLTQDVKEAMTGGSTAVVGADSVGNVNIVDKAVSLYKLEDILQENFVPEFEEVGINRNLQGQITVNTGTNKVVIDTSMTDYTYAVIDLDNNTFYNMNGINYYSGCGIVIANADGDVILSTRNQSGTSSGRTPVCLNFRCNSTGLKCYIGGGTTGAAWTGNPFTQQSISINKMKLIKLNQRKLDFQPVKTISGYMVQKNSTLNNQPTTATNADATIKIFKISKNLKYYVSSAMTSYIAPLVITDNKFLATFIKKQDGTSLTPFVYEFTAQADGYMILTYYTTYQTEVKVVQTDEESTTPKVWAVMGDSLSAASTLGSSTDIYIQNVCKHLNLEPTNYARGGAGYKAREANNQAFYQIASTLSNPDLITVFGSFNDTFTTLDNSSFGTINDSTTSTIFGAMNVTFNNLQLNYPNAIIGVIIPTPWISRNNYDTTSENMTKANTYVDGLIQICKKRNIPYLDLYTESNLYPWSSSFRSSFYLNSDGEHPNANGHKRFSAQIEEFIKSIIMDV